MRHFFQSNVFATSTPSLGGHRDQYPEAEYKLAAPRDGQLGNVILSHAMNTSTWAKSGWRSHSSWSSDRASAHPLTRSTTGPRTDICAACTWQPPCCCEQKHRTGDGTRMRHLAGCRCAPWAKTDRAYKRSHTCRRKRPSLHSGARCLPAKHTGQSARQNYC